MEKDKHWTDSVWPNKKFTHKLVMMFGYKMFDFRDVKALWAMTHDYYIRQLLVARWQQQSPQDAFTYMMKHDEWLKATVGNYIGKAIHDGILIRICPGWYMFPEEMLDEYQNAIWRRFQNANMNWPLRKK